MSIDLTKISSFVGELSEQDLMQLLASFNHTLVARQQELQNARSERDYPRLVQLTHNLKSNALYFGADRLHAICKTGETLFASPGLTDAELEHWFDEFEAIYQAVSVCIEHMLKEGNGAQKTQE